MKKGKKERKKNEVMSGGSGKERRRKRKNVSERCVHFVKLSLVVFGTN